MLRAVARLVVMALVLVGVLVAATALGLPAAAVLGLSITTAGLVGMVGLARRGATERVPVMGPREGRDTMTALDAMAPRGARSGAGTGREPRSRDAEEGHDVPSDPVVASMAPTGDIDPESLMPRWRRPSLLAARRGDPGRVARGERTPMRFGPTADPSPNRRQVRYAVVALLDQPDEVMGRQVSDLMSGDEVEVLDSGGAFWEVLCPDGTRGWVHRTTLGMPGGDRLPIARRPDPVSEPDDILTAVLSARGIR